MSQEDINPNSVDIEVEWGSHPTLLVDQIIGFTNVEDVPRVAFGQLQFKPNMELPIARPVVTLAATMAGWERMRDQISEMLAAHKRGQLVAAAPVAVK